ncbi:MAG: lactonase family protein, partial [Candidatus Korobacteraceae bacterium]
MRRAILLVLCAAMLPLWSHSAQNGKSQPEYLVYVGSYTSDDSKGIYAWRFRPATGEAQPLGLVAEAINPAALSATPDQRFLYAVNWQLPGEVKEDTVSAYSIDAKTGALTLLNKVGSRGIRANQVIVDPSGKMASVVNYSTGTVAALPIGPDGRLGEAFFVDEHTGQPLSPQRKGPAAHGTVFTKDGRFAFIAELGLDRVYSYRVDAANRRMEPMDPPFVSVKASSGPR